MIPLTYRCYGKREYYSYSRYRCRRHEQWREWLRIELTRVNLAIPSFLPVFSLPLFQLLPGTEKRKKIHFYLLLSLSNKAMIYRCYGKRKHYSYRRHRCRRRYQQCLRRGLARVNKISQFLPSFLFITVYFRSFQAIKQTQPESNRSPREEKRRVYIIRKYTLQSGESNKVARSLLDYYLSSQPPTFLLCPPLSASKIQSTQDTK